MSSWACADSVFLVLGEVVMLRAFLGIASAIAILASAHGPTGSCSAQTIQLPTIKNQHAIGILGSVETEIPNLVAPDADYVNA
jgi:hypothetical protein